MTDQSQITVEEGNKLIAAFDGHSVDKHGRVLYKKDGRLVIMDASQLQYHSSFDWIMQVVDKIEQGNYEFKMCRKVVEVYFDDIKEIILKTKGKGRLDSLWLAVVKLIQWYNSQKSKQ